MAMKVGELQTITIIRPDDWHLHLRDGIYMASVVGETAKRYGRGIVMPNLNPPVTTVDQALAYRERVMAAVPIGLRFEPLMTLYLTDNTSPDEITRAKESGIVYAVKYYPAGATTNSENGVTDITFVYPVLEEMQKLGMPLLMHGEVTDPKVDIFDREKKFIRRILEPLRAKNPELRIVFEHITTTEAVEYVWEQWDRNYPTGATITAHHLLLNRNALYTKGDKGGANPHNYCMPILKREKHRQMLLKAVTSGCPAFFLGTDSAPHLRGLKENGCGCAGCYIPYGTELYTEIFDSAGKLDMLEGFASLHGPRFYGLEPNSRIDPETTKECATITLVREPWTVPESLPFGDNVVVPFRAGETMQWKMV